MNTGWVVQVETAGEAGWVDYYHVTLGGLGQPRLFATKDEAIAEAHCHKHHNSRVVVSEVIVASAPRLAAIWEGWAFHTFGLVRYRKQIKIVKRKHKQAFKGTWVWYGIYLTGERSIVQ